VIRHLHARLVGAGLPALPPAAAVPAGDARAATEALLGADALDLRLHEEQAWDAWDRSAGPARRTRWECGRFHTLAPDPAPLLAPGWDHLASSFFVENTRAVQILARVVHAFRSDESLGIPSGATRRWLDATETWLTAGEASSGLGLALASRASAAEAVRRNAYWRMLGMDLAFGTQDNQPPGYDRAASANTGFVPAFEALVAALRSSGVDALARKRECAWRLNALLAARRQRGCLDRVELHAATLLGWVMMSLEADSPLVIDLHAQAPSAGARLARIGAQVGLPAHAKADALFALAGDASDLLRWVEAGPATAEAARKFRGPWPKPASVDRLTTAWRAATGRTI
jgi:hypothetical protein